MPILVSHRMNKRKESECRFGLCNIQLCVDEVISTSYEYLLKCSNLLLTKNFTSDLTNKLCCLFRWNGKIYTHKPKWIKLKGFANGLSNARVLYRNHFSIEYYYLQMDLIHRNEMPKYQLKYLTRQKSRPTVWRSSKSNQNEHTNTECCAYFSFSLSFVLTNSFS